MNNTETHSMAIVLAMHFVKKWEGFSLTAYKCPAGVWTIGWGRTEGVQEGETTNMEREEVWLLGRLEKELQFLLRLLPTTRVSLSDKQQAALVSFIYNVGKGAFSSSGVRTHLLNGDTAAATASWLQWNKSGGKVVKGLVRRRAAEVQLFLS